MSDSKIQSLNIWTDGFSSDVHTRNVTRQWAFVGQDTEEEYYANKRNPANVDKITYEPDEVIYKFNSLGVRSEEFVKEDCEILYGGCSVTSGAGLPVEHIWTSQLNSMINAEFGTNHVTLLLEEFILLSKNLAFVRK
jgi:hypothetical protein